MTIGFRVLFGAALALPAVGLAQYQEVAVKNGGTIVGRVTFEGPLPPNAVERFAVASGTEVCGEGHREVVWVEVKDGALRGAFVFLDSIAEGKRWPEPSGGYSLDQQKCRFVPAAQVVRPGPIAVKNSDEGVPHNVNLREIVGVESGRTLRKMLFNVAQPTTGTLIKEVKPKRSPFLTVGCDIHNFMVAHLLAPEHPYAVVVKEDGSYSLTEVPPGSYLVKAWHPKLGLREAKVEVPPRGKVAASFAFGK
ncbi:MAG: hypothetical protein HYZ28_10830 [Myxococcales bacterium]|nr:hypothetical protein [Myxococcales bacterium]